MSNDIGSAGGQTVIQADRYVRHLAQFRFVT